MALAIGALTGYGLLNVTPSAAPISGIPLVLVPTVGVPLMLALHPTSLSALSRAPRPAPPAQRQVVLGRA